MAIAEIERVSHISYGPNFTERKAQILKAQRHLALLEYYGES